MKTDKNPAGTTIYFTEDDHRYWTDTRSEFVSGTTFIKHYFPEFNAHEIARKKTIKECPDEQLQADYWQGLIDKWEEKRDAAGRMGTRVHENCEDQIQGRPIRNTKPEHDHERAIMATAYNAVNEVLAMGLKLWACEKIVFDESLSVAGTIDLVMYHPKSGTVYIFDWKTNETLNHTNDYGDFGYEPIAHLEHCNVVHYTLQLSLYEWLLRTQNHVKADTKFERMLIHLRPDGYDFVPVPYAANEITALTNHFRVNPWHLEF